ncbi:hypothetical protein [uncultured Ruminococcus sp.]|uniref:hypothetical protein n=1 Tax=uncultured Ruminococcus sp. TaxID=165186 RepID=UPI0025ED53A9|nr:hypothetical protein [uncultured Ruminococcus sp.]
MGGFMQNIQVHKTALNNSINNSEICENDAKMVDFFCKIIYNNFEKAGKHPVYRQK